jgi:DNA invertase Pin-like site-specific DNA recombinase
MTILGYARVSTEGAKSSGSQEAKLMAAGCAKVYREKASGAKTDTASIGHAEKFT